MYENTYKFNACENVPLYGKGNVCVHCHCVCDVTIMSTTACGTPVPGIPTGGTQVRAGRPTLREDPPQKQGSLGGSRVQIPRNPPAQGQWHQLKVIGHSQRAGINRYFVQQSSILDWSALIRKNGDIDYNTFEINSLC